MRIACVHLPAFPLQVAIRRAPHLADRPVAVVSTGERPEVIACSRAAHELGVRPGCTATRALTITRGLVAVPIDPAAAAAARAALAEALMSLSVTVDVGDAPADAAHQALFLLLPPSARGPKFAAELHAEVARQGFRGRVGLADDRFTAWAAAAHGREPITVVARGGAAEFLAPLPLDRLPLGDEVRPLYRALGIATLGDLAALPTPSVGRRVRDEIDPQELARGQGPRFVRGHVPSGAIREAVELDHELELEPLGFVLWPLATRAAARLRGRGAAAARVVLELSRPGQTTEVAVEPPRPTQSSRVLLDAIRTTLAARGLDHPASAIELRVLDEVAPEVEPLDLFADLEAGVARPRRATAHSSPARGRAKFGG